MLVVTNAAAGFPFGRAPMQARTARPDAPSGFVFRVAGDTVPADPMPRRFAPRLATGFDATADGESGPAKAVRSAAWLDLPPGVVFAALALIGLGTILVAAAG